MFVVCTDEIFIVFTHILRFNININSVTEAKAYRRKLSENKF